MPMDKYGIIETTQQHIPGDERSRTHPGHGYPAHTVTHTTFTECESKEEWEALIQRKANPPYGRPEPFRAIVFKEVSVSTEVKINLD